MGWGMGIPIGWPNVTSQQIGPSAFTGYMTPSNDFNIDFERNYTFRWWGGEQNGGDLGEAHVFFAFGPNLNIHSAFLVDAGTPGDPSFRFKYVIQGVLIFDIGVSFTESWNFYCIERVGDRIYFSINGKWITYYSHGESAINVEGLRLNIGSNGSGNILKGTFNNFEFNDKAIYNPTINFTPPTTDLSPDGGTIFLVAQGADFAGLKNDISGNGHNVITGPHASFVLANPYFSASMGSFLFE
jgi:hypothetical protein